MNDRDSGSGKDVPVLRLVEVAAAWRRSAAAILAASVVIGVGLALIVPREYKAVTRVLPPKEANLLGGLSGLSSLVRSLPAGLARFGAPEDPWDYVAILRSRTVMEAIVRRFDLIAVYDVPDSSLERAVKALKDNTEIDWTEEETLELRVWDRDARRAADVANAYVEFLNQRSYELQTQEARNAREFIERRVAQNRKDLYEAEEALREYQEQKGMALPLDAAAAASSPLLDLYALKVRKEIELGIIRRTVGDRNTQYERVRLELQEIEKNIARIPGLGIQSLRLFREVAIQQKIMELVVPLFEQAKVNEHKDIPVAYVLDSAVPGERPDRPKRLAIVAIALFLGLVVTVVRISAGEYLKSLRRDRPDDWERLIRLRKMLPFAGR